MPDAIKSTLTEKLTASFLEDPLKMVDTRASSHETDKMGDNAPLDVPPRQLSQQGCSRTNYAQMMPYVLADMEDHRQIYQAMTVTLADMFSWVEDKGNTTTWRLQLAFYLTFTTL
ncbi:uncharacterized protein B0H18DRAFT_1114181 [Fomitopsis serialis]|uniref:uncharacterized protein n=1 Tax=Fomitopsis serialis TaxID=139415 RepID=UPI0020084BC2|nr:uncharacterized protein B0H18DRAFT_1114181 [Neoantrodia serialis]KAH9935433.1 hypothetical protein B0H18DRAFT_1114181 [Neoantrodia serialis]